MARKRNSVSPAASTGNKTKTSKLTEDNKQDTQPEQVKDAKLGFLSLPGEIRNKIYGYVFGGEDWLLSKGSSYGPLKASKSFENPLSLLQTCKQVYSEACDLPFTLCGLRTQHDLFPRSKLPQGFSLLQSISVYCKSLSWESKNSGLIDQLPAVKNIHVIWEIHNFRDVGFLALVMALLISFNSLDGPHKNWSLTLVKDSKTIQLFKNDTSEAFLRALKDGRLEEALKKNS
ncbi:hypothetical protein DM02DRAFT_633520 [Periconia macrospinosa]|uniref:Uncharacterized protein n=1 Tax=Periconia macrospinosa TaxID=97972 RepID=A0A2V1DBW8_9PLEO|nr:hypothetical protein DM02DRAFT_633520 [Periconia macrospinosa]